MAKALTEQERKFIKAHYPKYQAKETARKFNRKFKSDKTPKSMRRLAGRMGLAGEVEPGFYTVTELAMFCGIHRDAVINQIRRGTITAKKKGQRYLIEEVEVERVIKRYVHVPNWPAIPALEAAKRLGYFVGQTKGNSITGAAGHKRIPSYTLRGVLYVPLAYIEAAELQMIRTGRTWASWIKIHEELGYEI